MSKIKKKQKSVQEIIDEMRALHEQEDDLLKEMGANLGSLTSYDFGAVDDVELLWVLCLSKLQHLTDM